MTKFKFSGKLNLMGLLSLILSLELVFTASIIVLSSHLGVLSQTKHIISNVLGIQKIAQDESPLPSPTDAPSSANSEPDVASPSPDQTPTSDQSTSSTQASPQDSPLPGDSQDLFKQEISPNPSGQVGSPTNSNLLKEPLSNPVENVSQTESVLNPSDLINSPDNINSQSVDEAKKEQDQINQTTDPKKQTELLINFATDKLKDMNNFTKSADFASTNFAATRFNDQIDKAISNLEKLPPKDQTRLRKQLTNFCNQADQVLRIIELSIPEELEQDLQIARGQCQELNL